jgi:uncharacterized protein YjdB
MVWLVLVGLVACGDSAAKLPPQVVLQSIEITPTVPTVVAGTSKQLTATGRFSDASTADLTPMVTWSSSATAVATVSTAGVFLGIAVGDVTITATFSGVSGTASAKVTAATLTELQVTPASPSLAAGVTQQLTAMGVFSDASKQDLTSQVTWASDTEAHATVNASGVVKAVAPGTAKITATMGTILGTTTVTTTDAVVRSIAITPNPASVALGRTLQLIAMGTFTDDSTHDLSTQATWSSATTANATISTTGLVTTVHVGNSTITAMFQGVTGSRDVSVTDAVLDSIAVTPTNPSVAAGLTKQFTAMGTFSDLSTQNLTAQVAWDSTDHAVAQVSNAAGSQGLATTLKAGTVTVSATIGAVSGSSDLTVTAAALVSIQVTPALPSVSAGTTLQFHATGTFTDGSTPDLTSQATWDSSVPTVATVSSASDAGLATTLIAGTTTISATFTDLSGNTKTGTTDLTVTDAVLVSIEVTPADSSLPLGRTLQFSANGLFSDGTHQDLTSQVTWASSADAIATISNAPGSIGLARAVTLGTVTISATRSGLPGSTTLKATDAVLDAITVTPAGPSVAKGLAVQFIATGTFSDGTSPDITTQVLWTVANPAIAAISNDPASAGNANTLAVGSTAITAALSGKTGSANLTVTDVIAVSLSVTPATASVIPGRTQQYTAVATMSDGTPQDVTKTAAWSSGDTTIAQVSNADPTQGLATGVSVGTTTINAIFATVPGSAAIVVLGPSVTATLPRDGTFSIRASTPLVITFDQAIAPASLTTQIVGGPCTDSLQLSSDGFTTCIAFTTAAPTMNTGNTVATAAPAAALSATTTYQIRVVGTVTNAAGGPGVPFTQATGFTTATAGTCATSLVISQVYGAGGNGGNNASSFHNDFIELHNGGATPVDLTGYAVQYAAAAGTTWQVTALPSVILPAGGYFLIQEAAGAGTAPALPTPDLTVTPGIAMAAGAGKVALTASTTPLAGGCPIGLTNDFVGYGATASCVEGTGPTGVPGNLTAVLRNNGGCTDADDNKTDFSVLTPTPRNAATPVNVCSCP